MTSERAQEVDFVEPYFEQAGLSIIARRPVRNRSLFKFLEVLTGEVWAAILVAIAMTALLLWFLDRYSPYSGQNNSQAFSSQPFRVFSFQESFWFAMTSFTPQGNKN